MPENSRGGQIQLMGGWLKTNRKRVPRQWGRLAQAVGTATFVLRGQTIEALAQPHRFYLMQRVQDDYASLSEIEKSAVDGVASQVGHDWHSRRNPKPTHRTCR